MATEWWSALPAALAKGLASALVIGALLWLAQRLGRHAAGLLAGLPTVTGPATLWLALDRGSEFAAAAAMGAVAAGVACALLALGYALGSRRLGPLGALGFALVASALPLPWLPLAPWSLGLWLALATVVCLICQIAFRRLAQGERAVARAAHLGPQAAPEGCAVAAQRPQCSWMASAWVSGLISALAAALAGVVGPFWAGMLTSPPLLAAAVALELHRRPGGVAEALGFLHGYTAGLVGRGLYVATFGALLLSVGTATAFAAALAVSLVMGWLSSVWIAQSPTKILARRREA